MVCIILLVAYFIIKGAVIFTHLMQKSGLTPVTLIRLITNDGVPLKSTNGKTNVLLLGIGGGKHAGSDLTDTMIVLSLSGKDRTAALISIPRDIWSDTLKDKVNSAYHYGEMKKKGGGMILARAVVEDIVGLPMHYVLFVDFTGFKNIIYILGGVDVHVSRGFTDTEFPIPGKENDTCPGDPTNKCLYQTVHFDAGVQHMDGDRALIYVRSRHAEGEEGSDFARGRRQQEILLAIKDKIMHPFGWLNFRRVSQIAAVMTDATDTDMNIGEAATVMKRYAGIDEKNVTKIAFNDLLTEGPPFLYKGLYVLLPIHDLQEIQTYITSQLK